MATPHKQQGKSLAGKRDPRCDVAAALKKHVEENSEILFALEAMQRSQAVQEERVRHLLKQNRYTLASE